MEPIRIAVVNRSRLDDEDVREGIEVLQAQVTRDFCPAWGIDATLRLVPAQASPETVNDWGLVLLDQPPQPDLPGQIGYHDLTRSGLPLARVIVSQVPRGEDWVHTASHELLEMLADPDLNRVAVDHPDSQTFRIVAQEICDPCEPYELGYELEGRRVSSFVFPSWFLPRGSARSRGSRFDHRGLIEGPFTLLPGGYIGVFDTSVGGWTIIKDDGGRTETVELGSRMDKRNSASNRLQFSDWEESP